MFLLFIFYSSAQADILKSVKIDPDNILKDNQIELTLDEVKMNTIVVNQNHTLYIDSAFFQTKFPTYEEKTKNTPLYGGTFTDSSGKEVLCLPAFLTLKALGVRYTFSSMYGTVMIRIRSDNDFHVDPNYTYKSSDSKGNIPDQTANNNDSGSIAGGYPVINYSGTVPPGYGYYYPSGYKPGFYFGDYGRIVEKTILPFFWNRIIGN